MIAIDWSRMARPQEDGYDTEVVLHLATTTPSLLRSKPYQRQPVGDAPTLFDGRVAIRNRPTGGLPRPRYIPADPAHAHLSEAERLLGVWPAVANQFPALIDTLQPWIDTSASHDDWLRLPGSSSHSNEAEFGVIMATVDSPIALAQAMVHEMAHHKLRAMGVSLLQAIRLVTNNPEDLYQSPIITHKRRPMTAVLHAQYSFIHVTALDVAIFQDPAMSEHDRRLALYLLARNVPRMEAGYAEIDAHIRTNADGAQFIDAFKSWSRQVLDTGQSVLDANGYGAPSL